MKKLLILILCLYSLQAISQTQEFKSYKKYYTEKDYTAHIDDTCKILITNDNTGKTIFILGRNVREYYKIGTPTLVYRNKIGFTSIVYSTTEKNILVRVELLYSEAYLTQISIIRLNSITCFILEPKNDWL